MAGPTPFEIIRRQRVAEQSRALENPGALAQGFANAPGTAYRYLSTRGLPGIGQDVVSMGKMIGSAAAEDPMGFAADALFAPLSAVRDVSEVRALARQAREAGDDETADQMEQLAAMSVFGAIPVAGAAVKRGIKAGMTVAKRAAAKKAASLAVKPAKAAAEKASLAVERAGIRAYHGSPHLFDKFDVSKIGTGEGAQSYGYGLYFAEHPDTATAYREALKGMADNPARNAKLTDLAKQMEAEIRPGGGYRQFKDQKGHALAAEYDRTMQERADDKGHMYEVNINADPNHFLDLNKPLSEQPLIVQDMARNADLSHLKPGNRTRRQIEMWRDGTLPNKESEPTGNVLHSALTDYGMNTKNNAALTGKFKAAGIPGNKYLDQVSREAGEGTYNYVVFDPEVVEIKRRYAKGGAIAKAHGGRVSSLTVKRK
jgi:hypothetical protein